MPPKPNLDLSLDALIKKRQEQQKVPWLPPSRNKRPRNKEDGSDSYYPGAKGGAKRKLGGEWNGGEDWQRSGGAELSNAELMIAKVLNPYAPHHKLGMMSSVCWKFLSVRGCPAGNSCLFAHPADFDYLSLPPFTEMVLVSMGGYPQGSAILSKSAIRKEVARLRREVQPMMTHYLEQLVEMRGDSLDPHLQDMCLEHGVETRPRGGRRKGGGDVGSMKIIIVNDRAIEPEEQEEEEEEEEEMMVEVNYGKAVGAESEEEEECDRRDQVKFNMEPTQGGKPPLSRRPSPLTIPSQVVEAGERPPPIPEGAQVCWKHISQQGCRLGVRCTDYHIPQEHWGGALSNEARLNLFPLGGIDPRWQRSPRTEVSQHQDSPKSEQQRSSRPLSEGEARSRGRSSSPRFHERGRRSPSIPRQGRSAERQGRSVERSRQDRSAERSRPRNRRSRSPPSSSSQDKGARRGSSRDRRSRSPRGRSRSPPGRRSEEPGERSRLRRNPSPASRESRSRQRGHHRSRSPPRHASMPLTEGNRGLRSRSPPPSRRSASPDRRAKRSVGGDEKGERGARHPVEASREPSRTLHRSVDQQREALWPLWPAGGGAPHPASQHACEADGGPRLEDVVKERDRLAAALRAKEELTAAMLSAHEARGAQSAATGVHRAAIDLLEAGLREKVQELDKAVGKVAELEALLKEETGEAAKWEDAADQAERKRRQDQREIRELKDRLEAERKELDKERRRADAFKSALDLVETERKQDKEEAARYLDELASKRSGGGHNEALDKAKREWSRSIDQRTEALKIEVDRVGDLRKGLDGIQDRLSRRFAVGRRSESSSAQKEGRGAKKPEWLSGRGGGSAAQSSVPDLSISAQEVGRVQRCLKDLSLEVLRVGRYRGELERRLEQLEGSLRDALAHEERRPPAAEKIREEAVPIKTETPQGPPPAETHVEELDVEAFQAKYLVWRCYVKKLLTMMAKNDKKSKAKMPTMRLDGLSREHVVEPLLSKLRNVGSEKMFYSFKVSRFGDEVAIDDGGVTCECFSLFFEQLGELEKTYHVGGEEKTFKLFELTGGGNVFLPRSFVSLPDEDIAAIMNSPEIDIAYKCVGKAMAKALIDEIPVPSSWASDLLLCYFVGEEPKQSRVKLDLLVSMLNDLEPEYGWAHPKRLLASRHSFSVADVLGTEDGTSITPENVEGVFREFVDQRIVRGRKYGLDCMKSGFQNGDTLVGVNLALFTAGLQRRLLVVGQEDLTAEKIVEVLSFSLWGDREELEPPRQAFLRAVEQLTDVQARHFLRAATGLNGLPNHCCISVVPKQTEEPHPTFSTCTRSVFVPTAQPPAELREKLLEAIQPEAWGFQELG